jgi:hypothetical protein
VRLGVALAGWLALGLPSAAACWRAGRPELGLALLPFAGALALLLPVAFAPWLGGTFSHWGLRAAGASLGIGLALAWQARGATIAAPAPRWPGLAPTLAGVAVLAAACGLLVAAGATLAQGWPGYGWDGLSIWLLRARVLAQRDALPAELFASPQIAGSHWDYPLLQPALLAWLARGAGLGVHQLSLPLAALLACLLPAVAIGLSRVLPPALCACIALAPLAVPAVALRQFSGYADPLLVVCATAGFAWSAAAAIRGDAALGAAGAVALACAASLKNEGVLWLLAVALACAPLAWLARRGPRAAWVAALRAALPGLALFAGWRAVVAGLGVTDTLPGGLRADQIGVRIGVVAGAVVALTPALVAALLLVCAAATWLRLQGPPSARALQALALWLAPGIYLAGILAIYLLTPHDVRWHLATSFARTSFALAPTGLVAAVLARELAQAAGAARERG